MSPIATTAIGRTRAVAAPLVLCGLVLCALFLSGLILSARAHAVPDPNAPAIDPRAQCESPEFGGVFVTDVQDGIDRSVCQYSVEGYRYFDTFENGTYTGTAVYRDGATRPTERPIIPKLFGIPEGFPLLPVQFPF